MARLATAWPSMASPGADLGGGQVENPRQGADQGVEGRRSQLMKPQTMTVSASAGDFDIELADARHEGHPGSAWVVAVLARQLWSPPSARMPGALDSAWVSPGGT